MFSVTRSVDEMLTLDAADDNLAVGQSAVQSNTTYMLAAGNAVDNDPTTISCTNHDQGQPWWVVDLGAPFTVENVTILMETTANGWYDSKYRRSCFTG